MSTGRRQAPGAAPAGRLPAVWTPWYAVPRRTYRWDVLRVLLSFRWLTRLVLLLVGVAGLCFLGWWQWSRAMSSTGSLQNLFYAVEWWVFAGIAVYGWCKLLGDELPGNQTARERRDATRAAAVLAGAGQAAADDDWLPVSARTTRSTATGSQVADPEDAEADAQLAAYNRYLAELDARARAGSRRR